MSLAELCKIWNSVESLQFRCLKKTGTLFDSAVACDFERGKRRFDSIRTRKLCQGLEAYRLFATA